jgi:Xaa-Pro aminopeptidase
MIKQRITNLRKLLDINNIDGYIVPKNDAYFSEFSLPNRLRLISNFSGSAGFAIILKKKNFLFVDSRYTIQAKIESSKNFTIVDFTKFLPRKILNNNGKKLRLGIDPQLFTNFSINKNFKKNFNICEIENNLIDKVCKKKSKNAVFSFYNLDKKITGESVNSKIKKLIKNIKLNNIDNIFVSAPENVAWLLNLRGKDNPNSPIPNSKLILTKKGKIYFFSCQKKISKMKKHKDYKKIFYSTYNNFSKIIKSLDGRNFCIDKTTCSIFNEKIIKLFFNIKSSTDPCYLMKSIKNKIEIKHMVNAHIKDGVALTKFIYWIKHVNKNKITEIGAIKKLEQLRKLNKDYLFSSFDTIAGAGSNGAIVHYRANKKTNKNIKKNDIFLCDSGGQYKYGTTDVTRTICFSNQKQIIRDRYTKVLKGHIAVALTNLKKINTGKKIDFKARKYLKRDGLDYGHGTGHGVGFFLNVHEGPQSISKYNTIKLREGMILSNEPGYYKKEQYGIRIENLVYIKKNKNDLFFENLTMAPLEVNLININLLNKYERDYLFRYHLKVYSVLSKYLSLKEKKWLANFLIF